jgi:hypothetical protein
MEEDNSIGKTRRRAPRKKRNRGKHYMWHENLDLKKGSKTHISSRFRSKNMSSTRRRPHPAPPPLPLFSFPTSLRHHPINRLPNPLTTVLGTHTRHRCFLQGPPTSLTSTAVQCRAIVRTFGLYRGGGGIYNRGGDVAECLYRLCLGSQVDQQGRSSGEEPSYVAFVTKGRDLLVLLSTCIKVADVNFGSAGVLI